MMERVTLQSNLENILGSRHVYFQPPATVKMSYPAIVYCRKNIENTYANNTVYRQDIQYEIVVIDPDPDSEIVRKISLMPKCKFNRHYVADNLNHDVFTLYT